jgi:two-component system, OmpR family, sensor histidine kinase VicK
MSGFNGTADLESILQVQTTLLQADLSHHELLHMAARQTQSLLDASGAIVELLEAEELVLAAASGVAAGHQDRRLPVDGTLSGESIRTGQALVCLDCLNDARVNQDFVRQLDVQSMIVAPLRYAASVVGVLKVLSPRPGAFDDSSLATVRLTAAVLGAAIGQARALEERERAEAHARETAQRLADILRAATELAIIGVDHEGKVIFFNTGAEKMLGYRADEIIGTTAQRLHDPREIEKRTTRLGVTTAELFVGPARMGGSFTDEWTFIRKDGSRLIVSVTITGMRALDGRLIGFVGVAIDITQRKAMERMKDEFISIVSHELRTPLTGIRASLGLVVSGVVGHETPRAGRMLGIAVDNTDRLIRLLNDIIDLERMRLGQAPINKRQAQVSDLMTMAVESVHSMADDAGVSLDVQPASFDVRVDPDRFVQVLSQVVSNAVKFSTAGSVVVIRAYASSTDTVRLEVQDQGPGIPTDQLERIFQPFHQVDSSDSRAQGGTGLGLAICRGIMEQHGGRIWAESVIGAGTTLVLELPKDNS